jgi:PPP family 3-phenylpropionic acid transporter
MLIFVSSSMSPAVLIAAYYVFYWGAFGIFLPYFSLWLVGHGLSPTEATRVIALTPLMSLLAPPLVGLWADARRARAWLLSGGSLLTWLAFCGFFRAETRPALYATTALFAFCRAPLTSLADATALDHVRRAGGSYGRLRLWGSLGFLVAALGAGALLQASGLTWLIAAASLSLLACAGCAFALPAPPPQPHNEVVGAWLHLLGRGDWWLFFAAVMFAQMANAAFDSSFSLHLSRLGFGGRFIGLAWATGVAAEIAMMAASPWIVARVGAARLFALAVATSALRWALVSRATTGAEILCLQPLHGITFGLFWVAAVTLVRDRGQLAPTAAQGLLSSALGAGSLVGMNASGALLERGGGRVLYGAASLAATAGALCAAWYSRRPHRSLSI